MKNKIKILGLFTLMFTLISINTKQICLNDTNVVNASDEITDYYSSIDFNKTGLSLRSEVRDLITNTHRSYTTYSGLRDVFKKSDADVNKSGNIIWFYTGTSTPFNGTFGSSKGATNREHVWPKNAGKAFDAESNCGSDAHHLRPTEFQVNSTRSDNSFDEVSETTANIVAENGSKSYKNLCYTSGGFFYPGEGYRGATARILMYVQTRWGDKYNLRFVDSAGSNKTIGKISTLMKWHLQEPVTEEEKRRNEAVYNIQGNRNPFIDHPELASKIYCNDGEVYNNALKKVVEEYGEKEPIIDDKELDDIMILGNASKTSYTEGEKFDPTGLNVIGIYKDNSTKKIDLSSCKFVDGNTYAKTLSKGTNSIICVYKNKKAVYKGIEVKEGKIEDKWTLVSKTNELKENDRIVIASTKWRHTGIAGPLTNTYLKAITEDSQFSEDLSNIVSLDEKALIFTIKGSLNNCELVTLDDKILATDTIKELNLSNKGYNKWTIDILNADATIKEANTNGTILYNANFTRFTTYASTPTSSMLLPQVFKFEGSSTHVCSFTNKDTSILYLKEKATCTHKDLYYYSCKECGAKSLETFEDGELLDHIFESKLSYDESKHFYKCNNCNERKDEANHTFNWVIDKEATILETGLKHEECSVCHYKQNENTIIEKVSHNHEFGKWQVVEEATSDKEGKEERICSICNEKETRNIPKVENKGCTGNTTTFSLIGLLLILLTLKRKHI